MNHGAPFLLERPASFGRLYREHSDNGADGDVMAKKPDGFDELRLAEFAFHARKQLIGQRMIVHQRAGKLDEQPLSAGEFVDGSFRAQRFDDFRLNTDVTGADLVARPGVARVDFARAVGPRWLRHPGDFVLQPARDAAAPNVH